MEHSHKHDPNSDRVAEWLAQHTEEFEGAGIEESRLTEAVGLDATALAKAIDHLESHEVVVRLPKAMTSPPQVTLKAGRGWQEIREALGPQPSTSSSRRLAT